MSKRKRLSIITGRRRTDSHYSANSNKGASEGGGSLTFFTSTVVLSQSVAWCYAGCFPDCLPVYCAAQWLLEEISGRHDVIFGAWTGDRERRINQRNKCENNSFGRTLQMIGLKTSKSKCNKVRPCLPSLPRIIQKFPGFRPTLT